MMLIKVKFSTLAETRWYEYAIRFLLGGAMTVIAGLIAARWGPVIGGLFLAFPAIMPASATLIEKHEREKKVRAGVKGSRRGKEAAALEAAGAFLGSIGLAVFGAVVWLLMPIAPRSALVIATLSWPAVSITLWIVRRHMRWTAANVV
jgi:hypothetical protein